MYSKSPALLPLRYVDSRTGSEKQKRVEAGGEHASHCICIDFFTFIVFKGNETYKAQGASVQTNEWRSPRYPFPMLVLSWPADS